MANQSERKHIFRGSKSYATESAIARMNPCKITTMRPDNCHVGIIIPRPVLVSNIFFVLKNSH